MDIELKPALTFDEQVARLEQRDMLIDDVDFARRFLSMTNYYRFSGYSFLFQKQNDHYKANTHFEAITKIMEFDRKMRRLLMSALETAEIYARTQIAYWFSLSHDKNGGAYYDPAHFKSSLYHADFLSNLQTQIAKNADKPYVAHHIQNYGGKMPLWCAVELISFSKLSQFFGNLKLDDQKYIARNMGLDENYVRNWLHCFSVLRNTCAHYGRLYATVYAPPVSLGRKTLRNHPELAQDTLFAYIIALLRFLPEPQDRDALKNGISDIVVDYKPFIELSAIGFPDNWNALLFDKRITY